MWKCSLTTDIFRLSGGSIMCLQSPCKLVILSCSFSKRVANSKYTFCKFIKELKVQVAERWGLIRLGCLSLATLTRPANSSALFLTRDGEPGASHLRPAAIFHAGTGSGIALAWATSSNHLALQLQHHCWCYVRSTSLHCGPKILPPSFDSTVSLAIMVGPL